MEKEEFKDVVNNEPYRLEPDEFWELVKKIDWPNRGYRNLHLTHIEANAGHQTAVEFRKILQGVLRAYSYTHYGAPYKWPGVSDDSFWDLTAHIVGLGKSVYLDTLEHPKHIENYLDSYKENFEYSLQEDK